MAVCPEKFWLWFQCSWRQIFLPCSTSQGRGPRIERWINEYHHPCKGWWTQGTVRNSRQKVHLNTKSIKMYDLQLRWLLFLLSALRGGWHQIWREFQEVHGTIRMILYRTIHMKQISIHYRLFWPIPWFCSCGGMSIWRFRLRHQQY